MDRKRILEIGLQMEHSAFQFYTDAVARVEHPGTKQMLRELAAEEARHIELFTQALEGKDVQFGVGAPGPGQDLKIGEYTEAPALKPGADSADIILIAIKAEMRAIQFYTASAKTFEGTDTGRMLLDLVKEEEAHKGRLERIYDDEYLQQN